MQWWAQKQTGGKILSEYGHNRGGYQSSWFWIESNTFTLSISSDQVYIEGKTKIFAWARWIGSLSHCVYIHAVFGVVANNTPVYAQGGGQVIHPNHVSQLHNNNLSIWHT